MTVLRVELRKLAAQGRVRLLLLVCLLGPAALAAVLGAQSGLPKDTLFGRHVLDSGFALPLLVLGFAGLWGLPVLTSLVTAEVFAGEDAHGTWQALLTRSRSRAQVFAGKLAAAALVSVGLLLVVALSSLAAGLALAGSGPLLSLSGTPLGPAVNALLVTPFGSWHGLVREHPYWGPVWQGALVSAVWVAVLVPLARRTLLTRDVT